MTSLFPTEFDFVLPKGWLDADGVLHREGRMRLATAKDDIACAKDPRVQADVGYGTLVMLSAVITKLGHFEAIAPDQLETLFRPDFHYLKVFYNHIHQDGQPHDFSVSLSTSVGYPSGER